ncbi:helix-turn-helix domain-containing protein [Paraburkholderia sp. GAS82]|uniref:helix-turn-helix domain-containing protein n=1 Tax=Paraburkholderia sp. GAS82 TaxID=3035137 RepID=UPI003D1B72D9
MGRKSALTDEQWIEIERRHLVGGEKVRALAKEFGIDESAIRRRINPDKSAKSAGESAPKSLKELAKEKADADSNARRISADISALPLARQQIVLDLAAELTAVSVHLAAAARYGAATAHRLSGIANAQAEQIDDADPLNAQSVMALKGISALTKMANDASEIGVNLLRANKEAVEDINKRAQEAARIENYTDEQLDQLIAERSAALRFNSSGQG